jgi:undecaprenyl-diphosphatase
VNGLVVCLWIAACVCWASFILLGYRVTHGPPVAIDVLGSWLPGRTIGLAALMTWTGYAPFLVASALILWLASILGWGSPKGVAALLGLQLAAQGTVAATKPLFHRMRPDHWFVRADVGFSYPSGHAATALVFYAGLLVALAASDAPALVKAVGCGGLALWIAGICWSRVALGAHYPSDVLGGALLGFGFLCAGLAVTQHFRATIPAI